MNLLVGAAEGAEALEGLHQPERQAALLAPGALADDAIRAALGQRPRLVGYRCSRGLLSAKTPLAALELPQSCRTDSAGSSAAPFQRSD